MSLNLNGNVTGIYLGSTKADAVYLGNVKVFEDNDDTLIIDGLQYKTVKIGDQVWMAENLQAAVGKAVFYKGDEATYGRNGKNYGRLYTWSEATSINVSGWHLPTHAEWLALSITAGGYSVAGTALKSKSGWSSSAKGTDDYGFNVLPSGFKVDAIYQNKGVQANFWSATEKNMYTVYYEYFGTSAEFNLKAERDKSANYRYSVRLVKDA